MKNILKLLFLLGIVVYLIFAFFKFAHSGDNAECVGVDIAISDSTHSGFITPAEAERILKSSKQYPVGKIMKDINSKMIEKEMTKNPFIKDAICYKTPANRVHIIISQRLPMLRIKADNGEDYYVDNRGYVMEPMGYVADLPVVTGNVDKNFTRRQLLQLGQFLQSSDFWNDQIEQINVTPQQEVDLIPRIGDNIIHMGKPDSISKKMRNLMAFYEKVMPEVGWNKYSEINIEHTNQIICTKRSKKRHS